MIQVWEIIDHAPTLYVVLLALLLLMLGNATRQHLPELAALQEAAAGGTFVILAIRRLVWATPEQAADAVFILVRATAFAMIAYGTMGTVALGYNGILVVVYRVRSTINAWLFAWREWRCRRQERKSRDTPPQVAPPTAQELARERAEQERIERERQQRAIDQQRRLELKLQAELEMEFAADQNRRRKLNEFIKTYADETLPVEVYEQRLATIRDAAVRHAPARAKQYRSMQEIIDDFERQLADVDQSTQSEFEKESLRSLILMEQQNALQRFLQQ